MLHVCFVRSYEARGRIVSIDADEARALPGVHAVFVAGDLNPGVHEQWHSQLGPASPETPRAPLAEGEVRFVGDPVALVIAESRYIAEDAAELVVVEVEPSPLVVDYLPSPDADDLVHDTLRTTDIQTKATTAQMTDHPFRRA